MSSFDVMEFAKITYKELRLIVNAGFPKDIIENEIKDDRNHYQFTYERALKIKTIRVLQENGLSLKKAVESSDCVDIATVIEKYKTERKKREKEIDLNTAELLKIIRTKKSK